MKNFIVEMMTNGSGISSKRINGTLGWLLCSFIFCYTAISKGLTEYHVLYMSLCTALLGLDSILKTFNKKR